MLKYLTALSGFFALSVSVFVNNAGLAALGAVAIYLSTKLYEEEQRNAKS